MSGLAILFAQLAAPAAAAAPPPDIEISARAKAREVRIEQQGRAEAHVVVEPSAGQRIEVERNLPQGQQRYRNLDMTLHVEGRLAGPNADSPGPSSSQPTQPQGSN
jgi:hypothetical protein